MVEARSPEAAALPDGHALTVLEGLADAVLTTDADDVVVYANPAAAALLGYPPGELVGRPAGALLAGAEDDGRVEARRADGSTVALRLSVHEARVQGGRLRTRVLRPLPGPTDAVGARFDLALEVLLAFARGDYARGLDLADEARPDDPLIVGLQMLGEELEESTVSRDHLDRIITAMSDSLLVVDAGGLVVDSNLAAQALTRRGEDDLLGQALSDLVRVEGAPWTRLEDHPGEGRLRTATGAEIPVSISLGRLSGDDDDAAGHVVLLQDITIRKRAEDAIQQSIRQLEQFAYVASHDLSEPLRKIRVFGDRVQARSAAVLDERSAAYLARMTDAARRMENLIQALLAYSRVSTRAREFEPVDLNDVVRGVLGDLEIRLTESKAQVEVGDLPTIDAEPTQMRQLLQNLLSNALKYRRPEVAPRVRLAAAPGESLGLRPGPCVQISVADNGMGFDEKYSERIFGPFQRLHGRAEIEGSGMGLAICQRIVERHGGRVDVSSRPGEGSVFTVTLPEHQPRAET